MSDILSNLEAWWKCNEGAGTSVADATGNGRTLTLVNTPTWGAGKIGSYSLGFASASSESGNTPTWAGIQGTSALTTAFWFKTSTANGGLISWGENVTGKAWRQNIESGAVWMRAVGNSVSWGSGLADGQWHHAVLVKPANANVSGMICYIDGNVATPISPTGTTTINLGAVWNPQVAYDVGGTAGYLNGSLDDVRIYSRAMSAADVAALYAYTGLAVNSTPNQRDRLRVLEELLCNEWDRRQSRAQGTFRHTHGTAASFYIGQTVKQVGGIYYPADGTACNGVLLANLADVPDSTDVRNVPFLACGPATINFDALEFADVADETDRAAQVSALLALGIRCVFNPANSNLAGN